MERPDLLLYPAKLRVPIKLLVYAADYFVAAEALETAKVFTGINRLSPVSYRSAGKKLYQWGHEIELRTEWVGVAWVLLSYRYELCRLHSGLIVFG